MSDYLPQELIVQILSWLPPKSLLHFRCVCKSWRSLITSPNFITLHTRNLILPNYITNPRKLIRHCSKSHRKELYSVYFDNESFDLDHNVKIDSPFNCKPYHRIVGSCNGLICLTDDFFAYNNAMILWNPAIRRKLTLPLPHGISKNVGDHMAVLGFGFDCKTNDYKIVRLLYMKDNNVFTVPPLVEVYTVKTGEWRAINGAGPMCNIARYFWRQAFVNGAVHWVAYRPDGGCERRLILSFDMGNEVFREIMLPECLVGKSACYMGVCYMGVALVGDSLSIIQYDNSLSVVQYDKSLDMRSVWVMKEYGVIESWTKMYNINVEVCLGILFGVRRNGEVLLTTRNEVLVAYDVQTQERMNIINGGIRNSFFVDTYKESFALLFEGEKI